MPDINKTDHERIWLEADCEGNALAGEGRTWCAQNVYDPCPDCGATATEYVRADLYASQAAEISRLRDALKPFAGDKLPGNNRDHVEYDRYGLRRIMSDMEIARRNAFFALYPEEHPLAKAAARTALETNHG